MVLVILSIGLFTIVALGYACLAWLPIVKMDAPMEVRNNWRYSRWVDRIVSIVAIVLCIALWMVALH